MSIEKNKLRKCLLKKFEFTKSKKKKHRSVSLIINGKKVASTLFSGSHHTLDDSILALIAKELWVKLAFLKEMYGCTKSRDNYIEHLRKSGLL